MHSSVSTEGRGQEEGEVKKEGETKERRHCCNLSNALSRQRAYKCTLMCLCLHGPDITAASREKPFYITVHILKKKIISTCCPLNDVYSFKKKKRVSLCQELCLS